MIVILAKAPQPGRCKTRLAPRLGSRGAAQLQAALLQRTVGTALRSGHEVAIFATPNCTHPAFLRLRRLGICVRLQRGADLGARMRDAARWGLCRSQRVLILGTDCPALTPQHLRDSLAGELPLIIPAQDGGYVGLALSQARTDIFQQMPWGSAKVLRITRNRFKRQQQRWQELTTLPDLDTPADWRRQRRSGLLPELVAFRRRSTP